MDKTITFESAQKEIAQNAGIGMAREGSAKSKGIIRCIHSTEYLLSLSEQMILEDELVALMPLVSRANGMAKELGRNVLFEIILVSPEARGLEKGLTEVYIGL